jgi:NitT/TauT family transport system substrate-binding protein
MQAKGQPVVAVVQCGRYPGFVLGTISSRAISYQGPQSLKGLKIGVTSPGSSTHFMAAYMLVRSGLKFKTAPSTCGGSSARARRRKRPGLLRNSRLASEASLTTSSFNPLARAGPEPFSGGEAAS